MMTGKERVNAILRHQPVDRIGLYEHFWQNSIERWTAEGHIPQGQSPADHFGFDLDELWTFNYTADIDFQWVTLEENDSSILQLDGNGARLRRPKGRQGTPEHVGFSVTDRDSWEKLVRPFVDHADRRRINFEGYRKAKAACAAANRFFFWSGINSFECIHPVCGHENMLIGMVEDPEWVLDMAMVYADLNIGLMKILFEEEGLPDGIWFYEDMGFKGAPFMSPDMYRELIYPAHKKTIDFVKNLGLPVLMHSCGFVEPLLDGMVDAGIDCLQVIEIKAGMDPVRIHRKFGEKLALCGGIDVRPLVKNDLEGVRAEIAKIPALTDNLAGYILHSDHSVPGNCDYATYRMFVDEGLRAGTF